jgi:hypothetical protein
MIKRTLAAASVEVPGRCGHRLDLKSEHRWNQRLEQAIGLPAGRRNRGASI